MQLLKLVSAMGLLAGSLVSAVKTPVPAAVYNQIVYYADFAAMAYSYKCPKPLHGAQQIKFYNNKTTDTQAYLFYVPERNQVVISFRGTSTAQDWNTDLYAVFANLTVPSTNCAACKVHSGFQTAYNSIHDEVLADIRGQLKAHANATVIVTGHSLGAALANFGGVALVANKVPVLAVFTFGEPLSGTAAWANYTDKLIKPIQHFRVTHIDDGVARIPVPQLGWAHSGYEYWESQNHTSSAHTTYFCGANSTECNAQFPISNNPNNPAHFYYGNKIIANSIHVQACGANPPYAM